MDTAADYSAAYNPWERIFASVQSTQSTSAGHMGARLASGPYAASLLVSGTASYEAIVNMAAAALAASAVCGITVARVVDGQARAGTPCANI